MPLYDSTSIQSFELNYLFKEYPLGTLGIANERRLRSQKELIECFITDSSGDFDLLGLSDTSSENAILMDKLLDYRLGNDVSLDDVDYDNLNYRLAKLIYTYLNLMVNGIVTQFDTTDSISSGNSLIDGLFELYVLNEGHKLVKTWKNFEDSELIDLRPTRKKFILTQNDIDLTYLFITDELPHDTDEMFLYKNGELVDRTDYSFYSDSTSLTIYLDSSSSPNLGANVNDILILDAFTSVNVYDL